MPELVSILVAAYNEQKHVAECLRSLLAQTYAPIEIIVVDDGSTDGTVAAVGEFPGVRVLRQAHQGKAKAMNWGAKEAAGTILVFLDADMVFAPEYVERMVAPILEGRAVGTSHLDELVANPQNRWARCWQMGAGLPLNRRLNISTEERQRGSTVYRAIGREQFIAVGGFDDIGYMDDQTLWPKVGQTAMWVEGAVCYHYNPETLAEVFRSGTWGGRSMASHGSWPLLLRYLPVFAPWRAARCAIRNRTWAMFPYSLIMEIGYFIGLFAKLAWHDPTFGK